MACGATSKTCVYGTFRQYNLQCVYFNCNFIDLFNSLLRLDFYIELQKLIYIDYQHKITVPIKMIHFMGRIFVIERLCNTKIGNFSFT